jgi:hypothetical protein
MQNTGHLKNKVTLSQVYNEVISEPTIAPYTTIVGKTLKVCLFWIQNAFCCGVAILQHGLPWRRRPETLSKQLLYIA